MSSVHAFAVKTAFHEGRSVTRDMRVSVYLFCTSDPNATFWPEFQEGVGEVEGLVDALPFKAVVADVAEICFLLPTKTSHQPKCIASR